MAEPEVSFGELHFGKAKLGDARRTKRLVRVANTLVNNPSGSLPSKFNKPGELDGVYHLMKQDEVTHASVLAPHFALTREALEQTNDYIVVDHDTTELDFTSHRSLVELGQIGNGGCRGYLCHNSLAIEPQTRQVIGLANQILWKRRIVKNGETRSQRRENRERESQLWRLGAEPLPKNRKIVDVCDRAADIFEHLEAEILSGRTFVIRSKHNRSLRVRDENGETQYLHDFARSLPSLGTKIVQKPTSVELTESSKSKKAKLQSRFAKLQVSASTIVIPRPRRRSGQHGNASM